MKKAFKHIWILRRLKNLGATQSQLLDIYIKQIRSVLEMAVPAWQSSLTIADKLKIERVQKAALHIILGSDYVSYPNALENVNLFTLEDRRIQLCLKFAQKAYKNPKHTNWFKVNRRVGKTRQKQPLFCPVFSRTSRFDNSPISYMTKLLNKYGWRPWTWNCKPIPLSEL